MSELVFDLTMTEYNEFTWQQPVDMVMERYGFEFDNDLDLWTDSTGTLAITNQAARRLAQADSLERYLVAGLEP